MSWWFQAIANPATTLRTSSASFGTARTLVADKEVSRAITANGLNGLLIADSRRFRFYFANQCAEGEVDAGAQAGVPSSHWLSVNGR